jgi:tRNA A37 threonylcarbamoyladenosine modification protein TsaB
MAIIGFYLSPGSCQLAWHCEGKFAEQVYLLETGQTHAGVLAKLINKFLPQPPEVIATTTGPGSFTSIRIQLATAIGLRIGYGAELFCPNTLDVLDHAGEGAIPCIDSFRGDYFVKINDLVTCLTEDALQGQQLCGDLGQAPKNLAADLVKYYLAKPHLKNLNQPDPYYVRTPEYKTRANFKG